MDAAPQSLVLDINVLQAERNVGVEVERRALAREELDGSRCRDHRGVVGREVSRREVNRNAESRARRIGRSEEHTSELQSRSDLVCRLLLEKKKIRAKKTGDR